MPQCIFPLFVYCGALTQALPHLKVHLWIVLMCALLPSPFLLPVHSDGPNMSKCLATA